MGKKDRKDKKKKSSRFQKVMRNSESLMPFSWLKQKKFAILANFFYLRLTRFERATLTSAG